MSSEPHPLWAPSRADIEDSNLTQFAEYLNRKGFVSISAPDYEALHRWSVHNIPQFWLSLVHFTKAIVHPPLQSSSAIFVQNEPATEKPLLIDATWFPETRINLAENMLRYSAIAPDKVALVYRAESADDDEDFRQKLTFSQLSKRVAALAAALRARGVKKGDVVAGILANEPNTVIVMLAVFSIGAVWSCCSPDFGVDAIVNRFKQISPVVLFSAVSYIYKGKLISTEGNLMKVESHLDALKFVVAMPSHCTTSEAKTGSCAAKQDGGTRRLDFEEILRSEVEKPEPVPVRFEPMAFDDPATVVYSSGTTGLPKCIVHGAGFFVNHLKEHCLHLNMNQDSTVFFYSTTGWMMYNWLVSVLALGSAIILYDGAAVPKGDPLRLLVIALEEKVTHFGSSARYFQALEDANLHANDMLTKANSVVLQVAPLEHLQMIMSTGSPSTTCNFEYACSTVGKNVQYVSMSGGTDILGCFALGCPWKPVYAPELQCPGLAMDVLVFDDEAKPIRESTGELVCCTPAPCMPLYFWGDMQHHRYKSTYFVRYGTGIWHHGDFASSTPHGGLVITGRSDTTLNPGGVRIGTGDIYHVLNSRLDIEDSVAVGKRTESGDDLIVLFVVLRGATELSEESKTSIRNDLRKRLSPRHVPFAILQVADIPYTFSGKKMESAVKEIINGNKTVRTDAMRNPEAVGFFAKACTKLELMLK